MNRAVKKRHNVKKKPIGTRKTKKKVSSKKTVKVESFPKKGKTLEERFGPLPEKDTNAYSILFKRIKRTIKEKLLAKNKYFKSVRGSPDSVGSYITKNGKKVRTKKKVRKKREPFSLKKFMHLHKSLVVLGFTILAVFLIFVSIVLFIRMKYRVTNVYVDGNSYYSDKEISDIVMKGSFSHNSLYLSLKYMDKDIENIPFIQKITVNIESANTVRINVYEKALAGCIFYMDRYMYFDREGIVVDSSVEQLKSVPLVMGLKFDSVVMYEALPVERAKVFDEVLDITQLLTKHKLSADKIYFDKNYNVYLFFENVKVAIGTEENIDEKVTQLEYILKRLSGKKGTLHLEDYDENKETIRFEETY